MATIDDVITWANTLPAWQGDAVRRLLVAGEQLLSSQDHSELLALAKGEFDLAPPPDGVKPIPPAAGMFSGAPATPVAVKLLSISDVRDVNIIASGQTQPFAESGVTVVYGDNGSGKSGYSRILKLACKARDKDECILPNVFATGQTGTPTATLRIREDADTKDIVWTQGSAADPVLTNIAVFDAGCARVITDERNEITYLPYGADVFEKLAEIVVKIRTDIQAEVTGLEPIQDSSVVAGTNSRVFLESLSETTKDDDVQKATTWSPPDEKDLIALEELRRQSDATRAREEITRLNNVKARVHNAAETVSGLVAACANLTNETFATVLAELSAAQLAHGTAVAERQISEPLPGVASTNQWQILYAAAKRYSEEVAYPSVPFPNTVDAVCVLCQQPLSEGAVARLERFKKFMEDATSMELTTKREGLKSLRANVEELAPLSGAALESIADELASLDVKSADALRNYHSMVGARKAAALALLKEGEAAENAALLPPWPESPVSMLEAVVKVLSQKVNEITNAAKPDEYQKLTARIAELKSRKALSVRKVDINTFVEKARRNADLRRATAALHTNAITSQGRALIARNITPALLEAFTEELATLGARWLPIALKPTGAIGDTTHKMLLQGAKALGKTRMSQVLSEGEARVIAIAGFLAELKLAHHANAIVLDDPVSSLDHVFTGKIAARLAREGLTRQVIIFTHNIALLMELQDAASALAMSGTPVAVHVHELRRRGESAGVTTDGAPWHALKVNKRASYLEQLVRDISPLYRNDMANYNDQAAHVYGLLREAWEACIEEVLFYNVVCRHRNSVQTLKLMEVGIEDSDIHEIHLNWTKASTWKTGHDKSKALHHDRPAPDELLADISSLRTFSKKCTTRRKTTKDRRKGQLEA